MIMAEQRYVATMNTPGHLPWSDDLAIFDTAREAWEYLADERRRHEDDAYITYMVGEGWPEGRETDEDGYTLTASELDRAAEIGAEGSVCGSTPGYTGNHDLGVVYSVSLAEE